MLLTVAQRETGVDFQMGWQLASAPVAPVPMIPSAVADQRVSRNVSSGLSSSQLSSPTAYSGNFDYGPNVMESTTDPLSNTSDEDVAALLATMPSTPNFSLLVTPYAMPAQTRGFGQHGVSGSNNADQPQERTHNSSHNVQAQPPATTINSGSYNSYNGYPHSVPQQEPTSGYAGQQQDEPYGRSTSQYSSQYHGNQRS